MSRPAQHGDIGELTECAMAIALSIVLGNLRLLELPNGGSIAFGTLPILLLASVRGARPAMLAGWCAGAGHALFGGTVIHPGQYLLDYGLAYAALGMGAFVRGPTPSRMRLAGVVVVGGLAHLACFVASGVLYFAHYAGMQSPLLFSLAYNASTVVPEMALGVWLLPSLVRAYARSNLPQAYRLGLIEPPTGVPARRAHGAHATAREGHRAVTARVMPTARAHAATAQESAPAGHGNHRPERQSGPPLRASRLAPTPASSQGSLPPSPAAPAETVRTALGDRPAPFSGGVWRGSLPHPQKNPSQCEQRRPSPPAGRTRR